MASQDGGECFCTQCGTAVARVSRPAEPGAAAWPTAGHAAGERFELTPGYYCIFEINTPAPENVGSGSLTYQDF